MIPVIISLSVLFLLSFIIRNRYKNKTKISAVLKKPLFSLIAWSIIIIPVGITTLIYIEQNDLDDISCYFTVLIILFMFISGGISFFATEGAISNTYFRNKLNGDLYIDINKNFIPARKSSSELSSSIEEFIREIISLKDFTSKHIIIKSHLITPIIKIKFEKILKDEGICFTAMPYTLGYSETATLNLWYGDKTRYRLFSYQKHANGFRVHRKGHEFIINLHP